MSTSGPTLPRILRRSAHAFGGVNSPGTPVLMLRRANQLFGVGAHYAGGPLTVSAAIQEVRLANITTVGTGATTVTNFTGGMSDRRDWTVCAKSTTGLFGLAASDAPIDPTGRARAEQA